MSAILTERFLRRALIVTALGGLILGLLAWGVGRGEWQIGFGLREPRPLLFGLLVSMIRDFLAGRMGVDAIAFVSMSAALALGENLAGVVVAVMYAGGNVLERLRHRPGRAGPEILDRSRSENCPSSSGFDHCRHSN